MGDPVFHHPPSDHPDDETFLDDVYAAVLDAIERGQVPDAPALCTSRPALLGRIEKLIALARAVSPVRPAPPPPVFTGYEVLSRIGAGGMGDVYLARQLAMGGRLVALKVLSEAVASSSRRMELLRVEALAIARLRHPGVVDVYEFVEGRRGATHAGVLGGTVPAADHTVHAFAMQWIQGMSLAELLALVRESDRTAPGGVLANSLPALSPPAAAVTRANPLGFMVRLVASVARTLHAVHAAGLLHRDIKPSNILLRDDGTPLLADFGLAREVEPAAGSVPEHERGFSGTRAYAPPEQIRGEPLTARADVFALGVTLREAASACQAAPLPTDLAGIIAKATAPAASERYESAAALADDLDRLLTHRPVAANPPGLPRRAGMFARRHRRAIAGTAAGAAVALVLAVAIVLGVFVAPRRFEHHLARARLELVSPGHANALWNVEWFGQAAGSTNATFALDPAARQRAVTAYHLALRWRPWGERSRAVRREAAVVTQIDPSPPTTEMSAAEQERLAGLAAYLAGDSAGAIDHWQRLAAREDPDAFIEAALGVLYLIREQYPLAYPRLEHARLAFPGVGFLAVYHADAAVGCGDLDRAERLLEEAQRMDNRDPLGAVARVRGDVHLARGELDAALAGYKASHIGGPMYVRREARIFAARGDYDAAAEAMGSLLASGNAIHAVRAEYARYVERWWESLDPRQRRRAIQRSLGQALTSPMSLAFRLREGRFNHAPDGSAMPTGRGGGAVSNPPAADPSLGAAFHADFVAFRRADSHASLVRAPLGELARRMEVTNMSGWNQILSYRPALKKCQVDAWASPLPRTASRILRHVHTAGVVATALGAQAAHAQCASPPCFHGLGDLTGGLAESTAYGLSDDGTTVVGQSHSKSGPQAFRWRSVTGMIGLGDLKGGTFSSLAYATSADGEVVVGVSHSALVDCSGRMDEAFRWTPSSGMIALGDVPGTCFFSYAYGVSADGQLVLGGVTNDVSNSAGMWNAVTQEWMDLGFADEPANSSGVHAADSSLTWYVGDHRVGSTSSYEAFRWSAETGEERLGDLPGGALFAGALDLSDDGSRIVGFATSDAGQEGFIWTQAAGMVGLGDLPEGGFESSARAISGNGLIICGYGTSAAGSEAVIWNTDGSIERVVDVFAARGVSMPPGWTLLSAADVTVNGDLVTICGDGINPDGNREAWIARYALPAPCTPATVPANPVSRVVNAGASAVFSSGPSGTPPFNFQWRKDGMTLLDSSNVFGTTLPVLTILSATDADAGAYDVVVTNACGSDISAPATLSVVCHADFNSDGAVNSQDFFDFLTAFFLGC